MGETKKPHPGSGEGRKETLGFQGTWCVLLVLLGATLSGGMLLHS